MTKHLLFGILLASGCVSGTYLEEWREVTPPANADKAIELISNEYKLAYNPTVAWYGNGLGCTDASGTWPQAWYREAARGCIDGDYFSDTQEIAVSAYFGEDIAKSSLAHEMCHHKMMLETGDSDGNHTGICFQPGGIVDAENKKITSEGF